MSDYTRCEIPGCASNHRHAAVGVYQVYAEPSGIATMTRPAAMCADCVRFARECGMRVETCRSTHGQDDR